MKKNLVFIILVLIHTFTLSAQDIPSLKVAILPIENRTENEVYSVFCEETARILDFNLQLLNSYQIENITEEDIAAEDFILQQFMMENSIDRSLVAHLGEENSKLFFSLSLFTRDQKDPVFTRKADINRFMEIFNITDTLITEMLEFLTGRHIAYGSINLENNGEEGGFTMELDGIPVIIKDGIVPDILVGSYNLAIVQNRFGQRYTVHSESITLNEGEILDIEYAIPYLTEQEESLIDDLRNKLRSRINGSLSYEESLTAEKQLKDLFLDIEFCPALLKETIVNREIVAEMQLVNMPEIWRQEFSARNPLSAKPLLELQKEMQVLQIEQENLEQLDSLFEMYARMKTLEAAGQLWLTEAQYSLDIYDNLMAYNIHYSEDFRGSLIEEYALVRKVSEELGVLRLKRRNVALPIIFYSLAAISLGGSITIDAGDFIGANEAQINDLRDQYYAVPANPTQEEQDLLVSLHEEANNLDKTNQILEISRISGYIGGAAFGTAGIVTTLLVKKRLDLKQDKAFKRIYGNLRWKKAGEWALKKRFSFQEKDYIKLLPKS